MDYILKKFNTPVIVSKIANIHYFEFTNEYYTRDGSHNFCELVFVDKGALTVISENYTGKMQDGQLIIHSPNEIHSLKCSETVAPNVIIIGFECSSSELEILSKKPVTLTNDHKKMLAEILKEGMTVYEPPFDMPNTFNMKKRKSYHFGADQMFKLKLESFLITLIRDFVINETIMKNENSVSGKIADVHKYITEHYTEKILLDNLCFLFGTNKTTLLKSFKQEYGLTIFNYINQLKLKEAKTLLRENELSVTQISEKLGFNSIHYFCRFFKKLTGQAPKSYIKTVRSKLEV